MANAIKKISVDVSKLDFNRVSATAAGAADGTGFIPIENISIADFGDENGKVDLIPRDDGTYLIEQDGIGMGFTNQDGYEEAVNDSKGDTSKKMNFDFDKVPIASSLADAQAGNYIDPSKLLQNEWGTEGSKIEFEDYGNGYYLIVQDGVGMGFTNQDGYNYLNAISADETVSKDTAKGVSPAEEAKEDNKINDTNNNSNDIIMPINKDANPGKYLNNTEPIVDVNGEKTILDNFGILTSELETKIKNHEGGKFLCSAQTDSGNVDYYDYDGVLVSEYNNSIVINDSKLMQEPYIVRQLVDMHIDSSLFNSIEKIALAKETSNADYYNEYLSKYLSQNVSDDFTPLELNIGSLMQQLSSEQSGEKFSYTANGIEVEVHKYEDSFTLDYVKDGHRVIETYSDLEKPELINSRVFTRDGEKYNIYQNGTLVSSEFSKISLDSYIGDINKHDADKFNEWYGYTMFKGKSADVYHYSNGDITFELFEEVGKKSIYTYDKDGNLKEKKVEFTSDELPFKSIDYLYGAFDKEVSIGYTPNSLYEFKDLKYSITNSDGEELLVYSNDTGKVIIENKKTGVKQTIDFLNGKLGSDSTQTKGESQVDTTSGNVDGITQTVNKVSDTISDNSTTGLKGMINNIIDKTKSDVNVNAKDDKKTVSDLKEALGNPFSKIEDNPYDGSNIKDKLEAQKINDNTSKSGQESNADSSLVIPTINDVSKIERAGGTRPTRLEDGSIVYNGTYDGMDAQVHEYSDGTLTVSYDKDGNEVIERFGKDGDNYQISNVRLINDNEEYYNIYRDGDLISSELQTIKRLDSLVDQDTKEDIDLFGGEWTAEGNYRGHKASIRGFRDGSYTIDYKDGINRLIYTYDKDNKIKNKKIINGEDEKYFEYDDLGNITSGINQIKIITDDKQEVSDEIAVDDKEKIVEENIETVENMLPLGIMNPSNVPSYDELVHSFDGSNLDYINEQKEKGLRYCVDVHENDGDINWNEVKESGIDYAIIRCSVTYWGSNHETIALDIDKKARENVMNAIDAGVEVSLYTYSAAKNEEEAKIEAEKVLEFIDSLPEEYRNKIKNPIVYDYETFDYKEEKGVTYSTRCFGMTPDERTAVINAFNKYIQDRGYKTMTYTNRSAFQNEINGKELLDENNMAWIAEFGDDIKYDGNYNMWQYSENGKVNGIPSGAVDLNVFYIDTSVDKSPIVDEDISKIEKDKIQSEKDKILSTEHIEELVNVTSDANAVESSGDANEELSGTKYVDLQGFDQHITDNINKAGYGTSDGVVSAMLSMADYTSATGKRIKYVLGSRGTNAQEPNDTSLNDSLPLAFDCSGIIGYCINKAGYNLPFESTTEDIYEWAINNGYAIDDIHGGKPGDLFVTKGTGHVQMIVGTYDGGYYIAEETVPHSGNNYRQRGFSITKQSFEDREAERGGSGQEYVLVDMSGYYDNKENVR